MEEDISDIELECWYSFKSFCTKILKLEIAEFHAEWCDLLTGQNSRFVAIECPRGHGKSTVVTLAYILWRLWREENYEICIVSSTYDQSKKMIEKIRREINTNPYLKSIKTVDTESTWSKVQLDTTTGNKVYIKPFNDTIQGIHVNLFIADDILRNDKLSLTEASETFWATIKPTVETKRGQLILVGTPKTITDLFVEIEILSRRECNVPDMKWYFRKYSAVIKNENGEWAEALWKTRFDLNRLKEIQKQIGYRRFAREYLCDPVSPEASPFPPELTMTALEDYSFENVGNINDNYVIGLDMARSGGNVNDWTVISVFKLDNELRRLVWIEKLPKGMPIKMQCEKIKRLADLFHARVFAEKNNIGQTFIDVLIELGAPITPFITTIRSKADMMEYLQTLFQNRRIKFPRKYDITSKELINEFASIRVISTAGGNETYRGDPHDDMVLSIGIACWNTRQYSFFLNKNTPPEYPDAWYSGFLINKPKIKTTEIPLFKPKPE